MAHTCSNCGSLEPNKYMEPINSQMIAAQLCFKCNFWQGIALSSKSPNSVRIKGKHYFIHKDASSDCPKSMLGFGGRKFVIKFLDGRTVVTNNLWHQGDIPVSFQDTLFDNAEFV